MLAMRSRFTQAGWLSIFTYAHVYTNTYMAAARVQTWTFHVCLQSRRSRQNKRKKFAKLETHCWPRVHGHSMCAINAGVPPPEKRGVPAKTKRGVPAKKKNTDLEMIEPGQLAVVGVDVEAEVACCDGP